MFCHECGKEIGEDVRFCKHCGSPTSNAENDFSEHHQPDCHDSPIISKQNDHWWSIIMQEFRFLFRSKTFIFLLLLSFIQVPVRVMQILIYDMSVQGSSLSDQWQHANVIEVNSHLFLEVFYIQIPLTFIVLLYAGSGMICNNLSNTKSIRLYRLFLGKFLTLVLLGLFLTVLPVFFLLIQHNLLLPVLPTFHNTVTWGTASLAFAIVLVLPVVLFILACSAISSNHNFAAITALMFVLTSSMIGNLLAMISRSRSFFILSFPLNVRHIGAYLFGTRELIINLRWEWSLLYLLAICILSLVVIVYKLNRASNKYK